MSKIKYKVSVRLMTYNHAAYICQAMEGILMQKTNFLVEVVVGDDFSTDNTLQKISLYKNTDNIHIKILERKIGDDYWRKRQEFGRLYNFINILDNCSGEFIALLDGDDYWTDPLKLQKQVDALDANSNIDICSHPSTNFNDDKKKNVGVVGHNGQKERVIHTKEVILNFGYVCPMQSILIRNNRIDEFEILSLNAFGSHGIMQVLWSNPNGVLYLPEIMGVYRSNSESSVTKKVLTNKKHYLKVLKTQIEKLKELNAHFNFNYRREFLVKISEVNQKILSSRIISEYEKLNFIRENELKMNLTQLLNILIKGWLSKFKYNLLKIGIVKSVRNRNYDY